MRHTQSLVLVHFGTQFTAGKPQILLKTNISAETSSLGTSNNESPRSQKNYRILVKLSKKKVFWGSQLGLNCPLEPNQNVNRNSHIAYHKTIHLYFLDAKFHLVGICRSQLYWKETTTFFGSGPNLVQAHFGFFGGVTTPVSNVRLS